MTPEKYWPYIHVGYILAGVSDAPELTPAAVQILCALFGGELHGYAIMKRVEEVTAGRFRLGPGTLYRNLERLVAAGLVRAGKADDRRIPYRITAKGRGVVQAEARMMRSMLAALEAGSV